MGSRPRVGPDSERGRQFPERVAGEVRNRARVHGPAGDPVEVEELQMTRFPLLVRRLAAADADVVAVPSCIGHRDGGPTGTHGWVGRRGRSRAAALSRGGLRIEEALPSVR
jgi:hypothetical protein